MTKDKTTEDSQASARTTGKKRISREQAGRAISDLKQKAEALAKDPALVAKLLETAAAKADAHHDQIDSLKNNLFGLSRLLKAWAKGQYREIPWATMILAVSGVLYFVNPLDIIPDFIIGAGYLDDATVLAFIFKAIKRDVDHFMTWENQSRG